MFLDDLNGAFMSSALIEFDSMHFVDVLMSCGDWMTLQARRLCQKAKSDKVLLMLHECLYRWMLRKKQLIPRAILRQIQEQIQKFAKLKKIPVFETISLWAVHDEDCNLNQS